MNAGQEVIAHRHTFGVNRSEMCVFAHSFGVSRRAVGRILKKFPVGSVLQTPLGITEVARVDVLKPRDRNKQALVLVQTVERWV